MASRKWTAEEIEFLKENYGRISPGEIARILNRSKPSIAGMAGKIGLRRKKEPRWAEEEIEFLRENWGKMTPETIARRLGRTVEAIDVKAKRLKLGPTYNPGCFTKYELCKLLRVDHRKITRWVKAGLLRATIAPTTSRRSKRRNILQVKPEDLEQFLRENPELWDSRKAGDIVAAIREKEHLAEKIKLQRVEGKKKRHIPEYLKPAFAKFVAEVAWKAVDRIKEARQKNKWLEEKRRQDQERYLPRQGFRWTEEEDRELRRLFKQGLTYREIGERLGRSRVAVGHRLTRIVIWEPVNKGV